MEGVGGRVELMSAERLASENLDDTGKKLEEIASINSSEKDELEKNEVGKGTDSLEDAGNLPSDGVLLISDRRKAWRRKRRRHGEKKKHEKDLSTVNCRQHKRNYVPRIKSVYNLRSRCQGSCRKRFVTAARTEKTHLSSSLDGMRFEVGKLCSQARCVCAPEKLMKNCEASGKKSDERNQNNYVSYAERPVSFISCGTMQLDFATGTQAADSTGTIASEKVDEKNSSKLGAFEMHTRGFGSRVMAKMGFVEGGGLGKDGRGIVHPIKAPIRPRSLGLGVQITGNKSHTKQVEASLEGFERQQSGLDPG